MVEKVEVLVVGGGQAGLAMSRHLATCEVPHLVLERGRIAERWRSGRWDALVANGPAWHDRFPELEFDGADPDAFIPKEEVADYFARYARTFDLPVRTGVEVHEVRRKEGGAGFRARTSAGEIEADYIVAATGPFQRPVIPPIVPADAGVHQIHSADYRNPGALPEGGVLVVGAGSSGAQIADELLRAGRKVWLAVGPHARYPRAYRGRDYCWWLGVLGQWDIEAPEPGTEHVTIAVTGAHGGYTVDYRDYAARGMGLVGSAASFADGVLRFAPDLADNIRMGDAGLIRVLDDADAYVAELGLDLAEEPEARDFGPLPASVTDPVLEMDLAAAGIGTIVWATGYALDYGWLQVDAFGADGRPAHRRGVSKASGVYFLGLPWLARRGSSFIWGVWHDARYLAHHIATHRGYMAFDAEARAREG